MKKLLAPLLLATVAGALWLSHAADAPATKPLRILLVAGGCCHDYAAQTQILKTGIESRIHATVDVAYNPDTTTEATFEIYQSADWAKDFDVILHDECSANVTDAAYVKRILDTHRNGKPAVNIHCAMHCYRWGNFKEPVKLGDDNAGWYEMIGVQSTGHGPKEPIDISFTADHPITQGMEKWTTGNEELYNNVQIFPGAKALASGTQLQPVKGKKNQAAQEPVKAEAVVAWTNEYGPAKTRIFSTTLGHFNETVEDARYLDFVTRGLLWATGNLQDDGTPVPALAK
ncbi:MAG: ThuA domain-containing protein [Verrucomicrobiales bacterium]|nr:ThuA domain-containing protein [Verrucomicrobiales bacterium]